MTLDVDGRPHVAFFQADQPLREEGLNSGKVVYGAFDGGDWSFEVVGTLERQVLVFEGARRTASLALTADGPMVAFIDDQVVALARQLDAEWGVEIVLEAGADPFQIVGLAVDSTGAPHLTFSTVTAHQPLDGEVWCVAPVLKGAG